MKNIKYITTALIFLSFIYCNNLEAQYSGSKIWNSFDLTGNDYKILKEKGFFFIDISGTVFSTPDNGDYYDGGGLEELQEKIYSSEELFIKLLDELEGEFFIGTLESEFPPQYSEFTYEKSTNYSYGLDGGYRFSGGLGISGGLNFSKNSISATFPVTVFNWDGTTPYSFDGKLSTELENTRIYLAGTYYFGEKVFKPFAGAGILYNLIKPTKSVANIKNTSFDAKEYPSEKSFGFLGIAGLECHPTGLPLFASLGITVASQKLNSGVDMVLVTGVKFGLGIKF